MACPVLTQRGPQKTKSDSKKDVTASRKEAADKKKGNVDDDVEAKKDLVLAARVARALTSSDGFPASFPLLLPPSLPCSLSCALSLQRRRRRQER
eukprot:3380966-Rhodomonas_salina.3